MASVKDLSDQFREAVRAAALKQGFDEAHSAELTAALIMPKRRQQSPFMIAAIETMKSINTLQTFVLTHRKDYVDRHRSTEQDRDNIEHEVGTFVKACKEQIDLLKNSIGVDENKSQARWLGGLVGGARNADLIAHQHGVVLILSEHLHDVTTIFDNFRAVRFQEAIDRIIPRWGRKVQHANVPLAKGLERPEVPSTSKSAMNTWEDWEVIQQETQPKAVSQQEMLDEETQALQVELTNLLDTVQETERNMIEMSALNHLFSTHVLQQAQQIEMLYLQALEATENVEKGNKELTKAIERTSSSRTFLILFLVVLPLALLFLHWYDG
eukprot:c23940_g1_i1 orf=317-1294(-)